MIKLLVAGTVAYDSIETPFGKAENVLGGSALHFTNAASFFADVGIVAAVGQDFKLSEIEFLKERNVDMSGLAVDEGKTFRWEGKYGYDLNQAITLKTELNVIETYKPHVPEGFRDVDFLFLANIDPDLQAHVIDQVKSPAAIVLDTMNFWIEHKYEQLMDVIKRVHMLVINEAELREISKEHNLVKGARKIIDLGPTCVVVKRGEYGVFMMNRDQIFLAPAFPLEDVFDPTGAGDTFAGGFMGYLANIGDASSETIKQAIVMGTVMASFNVEDFSINRIKRLAYEEIRERYTAFKGCMNFGECKL
ncbi:MAG: PfkB family carbohydrate kinase [Syntrophorhabdaceae bacterium]|nr:PfkB family carbohydrate kinase [Syntrophorhabdaceae bacterium]MDD5243698.1 PfkB family carbohydrate kinase [Syntrophorhabdaceae bacterium]